MSKSVRLGEWEAQRMADPGFRAAAEDLEPAYQVARLLVRFDQLVERMTAQNAAFGDEEVVAD